MACRMDPLWNSLVVGGLQDGKPFIGTVGMLGTHYTDEHIATGKIHQGDVRLHIVLQQLHLVDRLSVCALLKSLLEEQIMP